MRNYITFIIITVLITINSCSAETHPEFKDENPWSAMFYVGNTTKEVFIRAITGKHSRHGEIIYAAELAYTFDKNNIIRRFFKPVFDKVEIAGNFTYRHDYRHHDNVKEGNLYLIWRFTRFPWSKYLKNSIAIGDGISYASHPPFADRDRGQGLPADWYSKLLNYLMIEITFALPKYPQFELSLRTHHRCTAWGTFPKKANAGSTSVGIGFRYHF